MLRLLLLAALPIAALAGCATVSTTERLGLPPIETAESVDLGRYAGTWYEIASFPRSSQAGCTATTATYTLRPDGELDVLHRCRRGSLDGPEKVAKGRLRKAGGSGAKLEVSYSGAPWRAYWIVELADDYSWAVVGHPGRDSLWILSRTPQMDEAIFQMLLKRLQAMSYETWRLERTPQPPDSTKVRER